jgi:hypothetical protein
MFHVFPKDRDDWLRLLLFPFQAFAVIAHLVSYYLVSHWPHGNVSPLNHFYSQIAGGYALSFLVLLVVGFRQMAAGHRVSSVVNVLLAAWCALSLFTPGWIQV